MDALHIMTVITLALIGIMIMSVLFYVCEVGLACRTWPLRIVTYTLILDEYQEDCLADSVRIGRCLEERSF